MIKSRELFLFLTGCSFINGYLNPLMNEHSRAGALFQLGVLHKDFKSYFSNVTESIKTSLWPTAFEFGGLAKDYSQNIMPLPCDQRYTLKDMEWMVDELERWI